MKKHILLIEDDSIVRENTADLLKLANYSVSTATNGKEGVELAKKLNLDLVLCDIMMPHLDGFGVLQLFLQDDKLKNKPFIFLTSKTSHRDVRKAMEMGADDFITKPFEESELLSSVHTRLLKNENNKTNNTTSNVIENDSFVFHNIQELIDYFCKKDSFYFQKGDNLYCEGNKSNFVFLIKSGVIKTFKNSEDGKELITGFFYNHQFIGNSPSLFDNALTDNAQAIENSKIIKIEKGEIRAILEKNPKIIIDLMEILSNNINESKEKMLQMAYSSVRGRVAKTILYLSKNNQLNKLDMSRTDLANLIGIAKETLIRTLTELKESNCINVTKNYIQVNNERELSRIT